MAPRLPYLTSSLSQPANHASSHGRRARAVCSLFFGKERAPSEGVLGGRAVPLFPENPRRTLLGNRASGITHSRKVGLRHRGQVEAWKPSSYRIREAAGVYVLGLG